MSTARAYYNEHDKQAAAWLRALITAGVIAPGDVDERDIREVASSDLAPYTQCHFFAGIGGWSYALRLAGWPDDRRIWTGSCPCQPFSAAGRQQGTDDPRHLWPAWFRLIRESRPDVVVGEQVESAIRFGWLDLVSGDLEREDYAVGACVLGAHSVGAPHLRQRLYWVADTTSDRAGGRNTDVVGQPLGSRLERLAGHGDDGDGPGRVDARQAGSTAATGDPRGVADADAARCGAGRAGEACDGRDAARIESAGLRDAGSIESASQDHVDWRSADWLLCRDGKFRPVERSTFPLVASVPGDVVPSGDPSVAYAQNTKEARVMRLRGYGNSINAYTAAEFMKAYCAARS